MRLIDADALHKAYMKLRNLKQDPQTGDWISLRAVPLTTVIRMLNEAPTIEPKRGEWLPDENGDFRCTNCGRKAEWEFFEDNFCPNCGAKMKGADDE